MSVAKLQAAIRRCKTPLALGLGLEEKALPPALLRRFTELYGDTAQARLETARYRDLQVLEALAGLVPAVYLRVTEYLRHGALGLEVAESLSGAAAAKGYYVLADSRGGQAEPWLSALPAAHGVTVMPYAGGECCRGAGEERAVFALLRTKGALSGEVQNLMSGDRRLYVACADQMARHGCGAVVETGYALDIRELRRRQEQLFLVLTDCDGQAAQYAFDDYGHGALVVDDTLQTAADPRSAAEQAIRAWKGWVSIV